MKSELKKQKQRKGRKKNFLNGYLYSPYCSLYISAGTDKENLSDNHDLQKINDLFLEEDRRKILGGSLGFQGKRKGGSVIANRVESED